ncbi:MAG: hypothetical protein WCO45_03740 [Pseudanabaena sp. ELA607]
MNHESNSPQPAITMPAAPTVAQSAILCGHCRRTATNGIKCQGICVADSNY